MALAPEDRRRYLRHLLLAEVAEAGQERLLAASFGEDVNEDPRAARVRASYLERAGVRREPSTQPRADDDATPVESFDVVLGTPSELVRLSGRRELEEAAAALLGALSAVETLKNVLGRGRVLASLASLTLAQEHDRALP